MGTIDDLIALMDPILANVQKVFPGAKLAPPEKKKPVEKPKKKI